MASEEYRRGLKKIYAQLVEPRGWGASDRTTKREMGADARRFIAKSPQDRQGCAGAPKSAKRKIRIARELQSTSTATSAWIAESHAMGHPTRVCNLIRARCKYRTDPTTSLPLGQRLIRAQGVRGRILSTGRWTERPMSTSDPAPLRQAQGHAGAARHLHGGWKGGGGSRCRDAEACSLQRFVRLR
jgi:hypothetical protein